jgi:hypothetical protein
MAMQGSLEEARNHVAIVRSSEYAAAKDKFDELLQSQRQVRFFYVQSQAF